MNFQKFSILSKRLLMIPMVICMGLSTLLISSCSQQAIPLIEQKCGTCHSATIVYHTRRSEEGWRQVMHGMKIRGMNITREEEEQVYAILLREFLLE